MSTFLLVDFHINAMLTFALHNDLVAHESNMDELGQMLVDQNHRSCERDPNAVGPEFTYAPTKIAGPIQALKMANCYDYQACETYDYPETPAAKLSALIRGKAFAAVRSTPAVAEMRLTRELSDEEICECSSDILGYRYAAWEVTDSENQYFSL